MVDGPTPGSFLPSSAPVLMAKPHPLHRLCAALLLGSVVISVLAPGAVALSRNDIQHAAGQEGLSSDVQDFLNGVLEDAMLRAAHVAPATSSINDELRRTSDRQPLLVIWSGAAESVSGTLRVGNAANRTLQSLATALLAPSIDTASPRGP